MKKYKEIVRKLPYSTFTQDVNWTKVKENWTRDFVYFEENSQIVAVMSVIDIKNDGAVAKL